MRDTTHTLTPELFEKGGGGGKTKMFEVLRNMNDIALMTELWNPGHTQSVMTIKAHFSNSEARDPKTYTFSHSTEVAENCRTLPNIAEELTQVRVEHTDLSCSNRHGQSCGCDISSHYTGLYRGLRNSLAGNKSQLTRCCVTIVEVAYLD